MKTTLSERQQIEEFYHDSKYKTHARKANYRETSAAIFFRKYREEVRNLRILDYGCGDGWISIDLVNKGAAEVYGIDISKELVERASQSAINNKMAGKVHFIKMPGENMDFSDSYFDLCFGSAILHHTDLDLAIKNICRVLKTGGKAIFIEPMNQNIFLRIWRKLTPWRRSPTEKALVYNDLIFIQRVFPNAKFYYFIFLSILTEGLLLMFPNSKFALYLNKIFDKIDNKLLRRFPTLGKYCAIVVLELPKD